MCGGGVWEVVFRKCDCEISIDFTIETFLPRRCGALAVLGLVRVVRILGFWGTETGSESIALSLGDACWREAVLCGLIAAMLEFMDFVQQSFYNASRWSYENNYTNLTATSRGELHELCAQRTMLTPSSSPRLRYPSWLPRRHFLSLIT